MATVAHTLAVAAQNDPPEYYIPEDDCTTGKCEMEGIAIPLSINNFELDKDFVGSELDSQLDLNVAGVDDMPLSDEVFPVIFENAIITLDGVIDCFARKYPERAQLLAMLIEKNGFKIEWHDNPDEEIRKIDYELDNMPQDGFMWVGNSGHKTYSDAQEVHRAELKQKKASLDHWGFDGTTLHIHSRINKNIDKFNWLWIDDDELIDYMPTNADGAKWLNAVMGDWMVRNGIDGASSEEEFSDNYTGRIIGGSLQIVLSAVEVGGVILSVAGSTVTGGASLIAAGALTIAAYESFTQGIDMLSTAEQSEHGTGWLGDAVKSMATQFGVMEQDDYQSFDRYWSFAMLGVSLGGTGVLAYGTRAATKATVRSAVGSRFVTGIEGRAINMAKRAVAGVKNVKWGKLKVSYATLPSARTIFKIEDVGRIVAPYWDSLPRLRLRFAISSKTKVLERYRGVSNLQAGLKSIEGGISNWAKANSLVYEVGARMGMTADEISKLFSKITWGKKNQYRRYSNSGFSVRTRRINISPNAGKLVSGYNKLVAMKEVIHELLHAQRFKKWIDSGKNAKSYWSKYGRDIDFDGNLIINDTKYYKEEIRIESLAQQYIDEIIEPNIEWLRASGKIDEAEDLERLLRICRGDTKEYIKINKVEAGY